MIAAGFTTLPVRPIGSALYNADTLGMETTRKLNANELLEQLGRMTVLAISGGRVTVAGDCLVLPVAHGYRVEIDLAANDTYNVRRVFVRGARRFVKGERTGVYCDEVAEAAYRASCYLDEWVTA